MDDKAKAAQKAENEKKTLGEKKMEAGDFSAPKVKAEWDSGKHLGPQQRLSLLQQNSIHLKKIDNVCLTEKMMKTNNWLYSILFWI